AWRYPAPYDTYDVGEPEQALTEMLDPRSPYFAARDEHGELIGYLCFGTAATVSDAPEPRPFDADGALCFGLGLRPDLTGHGKGLGLAFVRAGLDFARARFAPPAFRLYALTWNERAIRVYERAGFQRVGVRRVVNRHGVLDFLEMSRTEPDGARDD
ncbi:MAG TPA: GNAT family N-acetyltransferase, partial [Ktedonobacterales bacterium]